jgi:hypothetical protein
LDWLLATLTQSTLLSLLLVFCACLILRGGRAVRHLLPLPCFSETDTLKQTAPDRTNLPNTPTSPKFDPGLPRTGSALWSITLLRAEECLSLPLASCRLAWDGWYSASSTVRAILKTHLRSTSPYTIRCATSPTKSISHHLKQTPFEPPHQDLSIATGHSLLAPKTSKLFSLKQSPFSPPSPAEFTR